MAKYLEAINAARTLRRQQYREIVADGGQLSLEHALAGAVGMPRTILRGGKHRAGVRRKAVVRAYVKAKREFGICNVAPVAKAVESAVLQQL